MSKNLILRGTCRRCKSLLLKEVTALPVYLCMAECSRCSYRTVLRNDPLELRIQEDLQPYFADNKIADIINSFQNPQDACLHLIEELLKKACKMIERNRLIATIGLIYSLDDLDESIRHLFIDPKYEEIPSYGVDISMKNRLCQLLFILLAKNGDIKIQQYEIKKRSIDKVFVQQIFPLLLCIVYYASMIRPNILKQTIKIQNKNGKIFAKNLLKNDLIHEASVNMLLEEKRERASINSNKPSSIYDKLMNKYARQAISIATGINIETLVDFFKCRLPILLEQGIAIQQGNLFMIDNQYLEDDEKILFQKLSLTYEKIKRYQAPCFFDLGTPFDEEDTTLTPIIDSVAVNWSAYYPCYMFSSIANGNVVYVTSKELWKIFIMNIPTYKGYLLYQLNKACASSLSEEKQTELRYLIQETHHDLEQQAFDRATLSGWNCLTGFEKFNNNPIQCGEIDLLATTIVRNSIIILVAEVKDIDFPIFKYGGFERLQELINHAEDQLMKKGTWIIKNLKDILCLFELHVSARYEHFFIAQVVVTSRPTMPLFFKNFTGCSIVGFESLCIDLKKSNPTIWQNHWRICLKEIKY